MWILFHHRAEIGCRGWTRTTTLAFKGRCPAIRRPGKKVVEPEVVATSPCRIKSPMPVCCGFDSMKWWAREDLHLQGSQTLDLRGLLFPLNHSPEKYSNWSPSPVLPRHDFFTKEIHRLLQGGVNGLSSRSSESEGWSQSPVLPWAQRAYETCLSAGSTAVVLAYGHYATKLEPPPGVAPSWLPYQRSASLKMLWGQ